VAGIAVAAAVVLSGCELKDDGDNLVNGKTQFAQKCAGCHTLARAGSQGVTGPNLDAAWQRANQDGLGRSTYKGLVHKQILYPGRFAQSSPVTGKPEQPMPAKLVTGEDAEDVAAYVAFAAARPGDDSGALAQAGQTKAEGTAQARNGTLDIPVGQGFSFRFANAEAPAGQVTLSSKNPQTTDHNIAVDGNGINEKGPVVKNGATSTVEVKLKPGTYSFYCSVPGHRQAGMAGKLTVK